ncbi:MAG: serine/threonine-protein kinase, partial [Pseudomonadota bacterium]
EAGPTEVESGKKTIFGYKVDFQAIAELQKAGAVQEKSDVGQIEDSPGTAQADLSAPLEEDQGEPASDIGEDTGAIQGSAGEYIGGYRIGQNGYPIAVGEIYPARDDGKEIDLQLLLVDQSVFPTPLDMERSRRELRQLQKLDCEEILQIVDHGTTDDGRFFVVTEMFLGQTLDDIVSQQSMDLVDAQNVIKAVARGLAEAQKVGVVHRDVAPQNVVVGADGSVKLRGFGLAAPINRDVFGTPEFMSPEQAMGRAPDQRSNIYSLGALMFYMLAGTPPFVGKDAKQILAKQQHDEPPSLDEVRPDLRGLGQVGMLIEKALSKSSSRRHLTLRQFLREVESLTTIQPDQDSDPSAARFSTPIHGVTDLSGGERPPSSEVDAEDKKSPSSAFGVAPGDTTGSGRQWDAIGVGDTPQLLKVDTLRDEESGEDEDSAPASEIEKQKAVQGPRMQPGGEFRETMWFYKGELHSAIAEEGGGKEGDEPEEAALKSPLTGETPGEISARYVDDGSMSEDEARRLSLRTGSTQAMRIDKIPDGKVPGKEMDEGDFVGEMTRGRKIAILVFGLIALAIIAGVVTWCLIK